MGKEKVKNGKKKSQQYTSVGDDTETTPKRSSRLRRKANNKVASADDTRLRQAVEGGS
jgi:hypothetical protein